MTIRLMIVDDHSVFRAGLRSVLDEQDDLEVVADAGTANDAIVGAALARPDVVLLDIGLPGMNGLDAAPRIREASPNSAIIMLTVLDDRTSVMAAIQAGATGYLSKTAPLDEIVLGIKAARAGQFVLGSSVAAHITAVSPEKGEHLPNLTLRETQLMRLLAAGTTTAEMATRLGISTKTVRNYLSNLYAKLSVEDRAQAALAAKRATED